MKFFGCYLLAALLTISLAASAQETASAENPYAALVNRNIFGLVPVPPPAPPEPPPIDPPPKITVNGFMRLFGNNFQVLFKTPGKVKPGQPPKEESYVMGEGERQDDIEVKKIDDKAGVVTFSNHGVIQELSLVVAQNTGAVAGAPAPGVAGGAPIPPLAPGGGRFGRVPRQPGGGVATGGVAAQPQPGSELGGGNPGGGNPNAVNAENLSPEAQVIMIEKNRLDTQAQVDAGTLPPLPPTPLTPADATGHGGSPLIVPDQTPPQHQQ